MPEKNDPPTASFFKGAGLPPPEKPKEAAPAPTPAAAAGGTPGLKGAPNLAAQPQPAAPAPAKAEPAKPAPVQAKAESVKPPAPAAKPQPPAPASAKTEPAKLAAVQPAPVASVAVEPPQSLPDPSAPAGAFFKRAEELYDQGFLDSAITAYRRGLDKEPGNFVASNNLAMVYIDKERYAEAREEIERAVARGASDPELFSNLGYALRKLGKNREAAEAYAKYVEGNPGAEDAAAIRQWVEQMRAQAGGDEAGAPAAGGAAAGETETGDELGAALAEAEAAYGREEFERALALYDRALGIDFNSASALAGRGRSQAKLGLLEEGLASLREAVGLEPDNADNHYVIGFILRSLQREAEAVESYERYLALRPDADNADRIRQWVEQVKSTLAPAPEPEPAPAPAKQEEGLKIQKQPAWAQALEGPPPGAEAAGLPQTEAVLQRAAAEENSGLGVLDQVPETASQSEPEPESAPESESEPEPAAEAAGGAAAELEEIRGLLGSGDHQGALHRAQELVGRNPDCIDGKILIARCFGQRGEFPKALAMLENLVQEQPVDEAYFFMGRCQQELGKNREAKASFQKCLELTANEQLKARVGEILSEIVTTAGGLGMCSICGTSGPASELADVDGKPVCTECRARLEKAGGKAAAPEQPREVVDEPKRAAKSEPVKRGEAKRGGAAGKLVGALVMLALLCCGGGAGLYYAKPDLYMKIRSKLPAALPLPTIRPKQQPQANPEQTKPAPEAGKTGDETDDDEGGKPGGAAPAAEAGKLVIDSPALNCVIAGTVYEYKVSVAGAPEGAEVEYGAEWGRKTAEAAKFDAKTGELEWRPLPGDAAGGPVQLTFTAKAGESAAPEQKFPVQVLPPVTAREAGKLAPAEPGAGFCLAAGDLDGDKRDDLLVGYGKYWEGRLTLYRGLGGGKFAKAAELRLGGRPVAAAIGNFGGGRTRALVADYWNARLALVSYENGALTASSAEIDNLPGRPTLAAFGNPDGEGPLGAAVLCPEEGVVAVYDVMAGNRLSLQKQVRVPEGAEWQALHLLDRGGEGGKWAALALVRSGKEQPNLYLRNLGDAAGDWTPCNLGEGLMQASAAGDVAGEVTPPLSDVAAACGARGAVLQALLGQPGGKTALARPEPVGEGGYVVALAAADLDGNGTQDLVYLLKDRIYYRVRTPQGRALRLVTVRLPASGYPPMTAVATGKFSGGPGTEVAYLDRGGNLVAVGIAGE